MKNGRKTHTDMVEHLYADVIDTESVEISNETYSENEYNATDNVVMDFEYKVCQHCGAKQVVGNYFDTWFVFRKLKHLIFSEENCKVCGKGL